MFRLVECLKQSRMYFSDQQLSTNTYINFAFPGFQEQTFVLLHFSVIEPYCFFQDSGVRAFSDEVWSGALSAQSVAKELMQSSPDVSNFFLEGKSETGRRVMHFSTLGTLHNLVLASFLRVKEKQLKPGDRIAWRDVLKTVEEDGTHSDRLPNREFLNLYRDVRFALSGGSLLCLVGRFIMCTNRVLNKCCSF